MEDADINDVGGRGWLTGKRLTRRSPVEGGRLVCGCPMAPVAEQGLAARVREGEYRESGLILYWNRNPNSKLG